MWATITKPFAWLMVKLYELTGNYGLAVIFFALLVNLILAPFMGKSKKSMMRTTRLQPKIQELQRRHEGNQQKLQQEMQKLYQEEGISPMSGCLWSMLPFPILIALYSVIRQPLSRMMFVAEETLAKLSSHFAIAAEGRSAAYAEIQIVDKLHADFSGIVSQLGINDPKLIDIDLAFLGMNMGDQPRLGAILEIGQGDVSVWLPALGLFLIPFISAFLSWVSMKVSAAGSPQDPSTAASMQTMNLMMPLMSIWICFSMPAAMGIYWIANSVFNMIRDIIFTKIFKKQLEKEDAERIAARSAREKELEEKRLETERLRAEGKTVKNTNTSKKNIRAQEKQQLDERKAALEKEERAARRERLGIKEVEKPASQVGNRRYARGRAYVPDRFSNPENAEAATIAALAESENAESIDLSVEEEAIVAAELAEAVEEVILPEVNEGSEEE